MHLYKQSKVCIFLSMMTGMVAVSLCLGGDSVHRSVLRGNSHETCNFLWHFLTLPSFLRYPLDIQWYLIYIYVIQINLHMFDTLLSCYHTCFTKVYFTKHMVKIILVFYLPINVKINSIMANSKVRVLILVSYGFNVFSSFCVTRMFFVSLSKTLCRN